MYEGLEQAKQSYRIPNLNNRETVEYLYETYGKKLLAYAVRRWDVDEDSSWEMIYETIYKVCETRKRYEFETEKHFSAFVFRIFINKLRNHYQKNKKIEENFSLTGMNEETTSVPAEASLPEEPVSEKIAILSELLDELEDWQRILVLQRSEGIPYSRIAEFVDKPEDQLKVYYQRIKQQISQKFNERLHVNK